LGVLVEEEGKRRRLPSNYRFKIGKRDRGKRRKKFLSRAPVAKEIIVRTVIPSILIGNLTICVIVQGV
jgi:hypothetical protein